jgi:hypothetical protein
VNDLGDLADDFFTITHGEHIDIVRDTCAERKEMYRSHGFLRQVLRVLAARDESGVARTPT